MNTSRSCSLGDVSSTWNQPATTVSAHAAITSSRWETGVSDAVNGTRHASSTSSSLGVATASKTRAKKMAPSSSRGGVVSPKYAYPTSSGCGTLIPVSSWSSRDAALSKDSSSSTIPPGSSNDRRHQLRPKRTRPECPSATTTSASGHGVRALASLSPAESVRTISISESPRASVAIGAAGISAILRAARVTAPSPRRDRAWIVRSRSDRPHGLVSLRQRR